MTEDQQTYQRGRTASLLGLFVQLLATVGLFILWRWGGSLALEPAFWHALGGLGIWVALAIVFQQHKLERIESLEAEAIRRRHGGDTSIFENRADDLAVAQKRLRWLYRWVVPAVALLTAVYLIAVGAWLLKRNTGIGFDKIIVPTNPLAIMAATAAVAFIGFLISRYLAGMARLSHWQLLRSGAAYLMGSVVVATATLAAAAAIALNGELSEGIRLLAFVVPVLMMVIGAEMVLNFILDLYRPRRTGETPRAAFDSRLLSFLTSPESIAKSISEAINYQFGFEITRSWFWQLLSRQFARLVLLGVAVLLLISCVVIVEPNQRALVMHFGKLSGEPREPGMSLKLPWPLGKTEFFDVTSVRVVTIGKAEGDLPRKPQDPMNPGTTNENIVLWSNRHVEDELDLIVAPPEDLGAFGGQDELSAAVEQGTVEGEAAKTAALAPPVSLVNVEVMVSYRVSPEKLLQYVLANADANDVEHKREATVRERSRWGAADWDKVKFKPSPNDHVRRLERLAATVVSRFLVRHTIDEWIGSASLEAGDDLLASIRTEADAMGLGVDILDLSIAGVHPPQSVADAFHDVVNAQQKKETAIETARSEAIQTLVASAGSVNMANAISEKIDQIEKLRTGGGTPEAVAAEEAKLDELLRKAEGQTAVTIAEARSNRWERENNERGRAAAFAIQLQAYQAAPRLYLARSFLQIAAEGYRDARKFVIATDRSKLRIRGDFKEVPGVIEFEKPDSQK